MATPKMEFSKIEADTMVEFLNQIINTRFDMNEDMLYFDKPYSCAREEAFSYFKGYQSPKGNQYTIEETFDHWIHTVTIKIKPMKGTGKRKPYIIKIWCIYAPISTKRIHNGAQIYAKFCGYAGITFIQDSGCDKYTGTTGVTVYNNAIIKGKIRWSDTIYGDMVTVYNSGADELHDNLLSGKFKIPEEYTKTQAGLTYITRHGFEDWLNDEILKSMNQIL